MKRAFLGLHTLSPVGSSVAQGSPVSFDVDVSEQSLRHFTYYMLIMLERSHQKSKSDSDSQALIEAETKALKFTEPEISCGIELLALWISKWDRLGHFNQELVRKWKGIRISRRGNR